MLSGGKVAGYSALFGLSKGKRVWWSFLRDSKGARAKAKLHTDDSPSHVRAQRLLQALERNQSKWLTWQHSLVVSQVTKLISHKSSCLNYT